MTETNANGSSDSPPLRSTILSSFLRGRPRVPSQHNILSISIDPNAAPAAAAAAEPPTSIPPTSPSLSATRRRHGSPSGAAPPGNGNSSGLNNTATPNSTGPNHNNNHNNASSQGGGLSGSNSVPPTPNTTHNNNNNNVSSGLGLTQMLRRRRSAGNVQNANHNNNSNSNNNSGNGSNMVPPAPSVPPPGLASGPSGTNGAPGAGGSNPTVHRIRLVPQLESRRSLRFDPINRQLKAGDPVLRIGRFTDRSGLGLATLANATTSSKLAFKSKVVSRAHAEIWVDDDGKFWIKDTKSSSGTFLNHIRLSLAGTESKPFPIRDGDILQLGVDYQGGTEDIYKSVKIRVEIGREWQRAANVFNTTALKNLKALTTSDPNAHLKNPSSTPGKPCSTKISGIPDCCICLFPVSIRQAVFLAPCSHAFHYKCVRPIISNHFPAFSCPLCRTFADLEEDVEVDEEEMSVAAAGMLALDEMANAAEGANAPPGVQHQQSQGGGSEASALRAIAAAASAAASLHHHHSITEEDEEDAGVGGDDEEDYSDVEDDEIVDLVVVGGDSIRRHSCNRRHNSHRGGSGGAGAASTAAGAETEVETDFPPPHSAVVRRGGGGPLSAMDVDEEGGGSGGGGGGGFGEGTDSDHVMDHTLGTHGRRTTTQRPPNSGIMGTTGAAIPIYRGGEAAPGDDMLLDLDSSGSGTGHGGPHSGSGGGGGARGSIGGDFFEGLELVNGIPVIQNVTGSGQGGAEKRKRAAGAAVP